MNIQNTSVGLLFQTGFTENLERAVLVARTIDHPYRKKIIKLLSESPRTVKEIYRALMISQSDCSQHLAALRKYRLVATKRLGRAIVYSVNFERFSQINRACRQLIN